MIKIMIGLFSGVMFILGSALFINYLRISNKTDIHEDEKNGYLVFAIIIWAFVLLFLCLIACTWERVKLAAVIIQATADYITDIKRVLFVPTILFVMLVTFIAWWAWSGALLFSSGNVEHDPKLPFGNIKRTSFVDSLWYFHLFYLLWSVFFIDHLGNFVLCAVASIWYFAQDRHNLNSPIQTAFKWGMIYHFGTVAFGSLILAIIWVIKITLEYMKQAAEK
jgi:solute carrier family 44 (choline transporter-like protein), member 2/4/5